MSWELVISGAAVVPAVAAMVFTGWKAKKDSEDKRLKEDAANVKAPFEAQAMVFTAGIEGSEKAMMLFKQVAESAQKDADRKALENEKLLARIASLEAEVGQRDEKIRKLQDDVWRIQRELNSLSNGGV